MAIVRLLIERYQVEKLTWRTSIMVAIVIGISIDLLMAETII